MYRRAVLVRVLSGVALLAGFLPATAHAQEQEQTLDQEINDAVSPVTDKIVEIVFYELDLGGTGLPLIVVWLILGAIFFTLYLGFINVRGFRQSLRIVRGDYNNDDDPGEVSHFTALTAALSGTVGLGNIAGVAVAVTVVICTMTALILIVSGVLATDAEGVALTSAAYETVLPWFDVVLAVAVILFAFSTMLAWSYYGSKAVGYLFGDSRAAELVFKLVFCLFIVIGATMELDAIIGFSDAMIFSMALFNIAGLYLLAPVVKRELQSYQRRLGAGEILTAKEREREEALVAPEPRTPTPR